MKPGEVKPRLLPRNALDDYHRPYGVPRPAPTAAAHALEPRAASRQAKRRNARGARPNVGLEALYRQKLDTMVGEMNASVLYWLRAAYRKHEPEMARDGDVGRGDDGSGLLSNRVGDGDGIFEEARRRDALGYALHLKGVSRTADTDKWHSYYDFDRQLVVLEAKFFRESSERQLHTFLHEIGHRGQQVDPGGFAAFKKLHESNLKNFESMANPVHLHDEREGHLHNMAEEVWAESYARWCLGLDMPEQLRTFWEARESVGGQDGISADGSGVDDDCRSRDANALLADNSSRGYVGAHLAFDRRTPADWLKDAFDTLAKRWLRRFDEGADKLADWFATATKDRSDAALRDLLRRGGFSVRFVMTPAMRDVLDATVHENVSLIKSIPRQYLTQVEGSVMRSVSAGRDLASLTTELRQHHGVTKRRARFIALDQNNKATATFTRVRQMEHGFKAIWMHSDAGKHPRPTHKANDGKPYDPAVGWFDPHERKRIFPGQLINCRCFSKTVIPGFE